MQWLCSHPSSHQQWLLHDPLKESLLPLPRCNPVDTPFSMICSLAGFALKIEIYFLRVKLGTGISHSTENSPPVRIMSIDGCFGQGRHDNGFGLRSQPVPCSLHATTFTSKRQVAPSPSPAIFLARVLYLHS